MSDGETSGDEVRHPSTGIDERIHQKTRLGIMSVLSAADSVEFTRIQRILDMDAGNLSRHLKALQDAALVRSEKGYHERRPRTWISLTREGKVALAQEIQVLRSIIEQVDQVAGSTDPVTGTAQ
ncbi:transcriptional regulator [Rhodococcus sp. IEGM1428]|uniref:transcriptional regulator n=1 Tax=Rhodococcus sp. IEGM1428 TaxID=3392191 RepID=UPI003D096663